MLERQDYTSHTAQKRKRKKEIGKNANKQTKEQTGKAFKTKGKSNIRQKYTKKLTLTHKKRKNNERNQKRRE